MQPAPNADGEIADIVMLDFGEARGEEENIDLRRQISSLLLGEAPGGNHAQATLIGKAQDGGNLVGRTRRDRERRSNAQNVPTPAVPPGLP